MGPPSGHDDFKLCINVGQGQAHSGSGKVCATSKHPTVLLASYTEYTPHVDGAAEGSAELSSCATTPEKYKMAAKKEEDKSFMWIFAAWGKCPGICPNKIDDQNKKLGVRWATNEVV